MEYRIIEAGTAYDLTILINEHIAEGWRPIGGVAFAVLEYENLKIEKIAEYNYAQAIILDDLAL